MAPPFTWGMPFILENGEGIPGEEGGSPTFTFMLECIVMLLSSLTYFMATTVYNQIF